MGLFDRWRGNKETGNELPEEARVKIAEDGSSDGTTMRITIGDRSLDFDQGQESEYQAALAKARELSKTVGNADEIRAQVMAFETEDKKAA
jgi:hypothetical protein